MSSSPHSTLIWLAGKSLPSGSSPICENILVLVCPKSPLHLPPSRSSQRDEEVVPAWQFGGESSGPLLQWRCLRLANVRDARTRNGHWYAGGSHKTEQKCVTDIDLDIDVHCPQIALRRSRLLFET